MSAAIPKPGTPRAPSSRQSARGSSRQASSRQTNSRQNGGMAGINQLSQQQQQQDLDPKLVQLVWTSLKDRIYQRSHNLRHTFRELDAEGKGLIPLEDFRAEMGRAYQLSRVESQCLGMLLQEADFRKDGKLDFREFCEMLKSRDKNGSNELSTMERKRFDRCEMDKKMQWSVLKGDSQKPIKIVGGMPTNELGRMTIDAPYGVLGDSERMDAVIASFLDVKMDSMRATFRQFDTNNNGRVSHKEFREGMKSIDPYVFDDEIDIVIAALDKKKKGYILIEEFMGGMGKEYLKKKAHRTQAHESPFCWPEPPARSSRPSTQDGGAHTARAGGGGATTSHQHVSPFRKSVQSSRLNKASKLRLSDSKDKLAEIYKREDGNFNARLIAGTTTAIPRPPPILGVSQKKGADGLMEGSYKSAGASGSPRLPRLGSK